MIFQIITTNTDNIVKAWGNIETTATRWVNHTSGKNYTIKEGFTVHNVDNDLQPRPDTPVENLYCYTPTLGFYANPAISMVDAITYENRFTTLDNRTRSNKDDIDAIIAVLLANGMTP